jgi:hypothetical protein
MRNCSIGAFPAPCVTANSVVSRTIAVAARITSWYRPILSPKW